MERDSIVAITKEYVLARHVPVAKTLHTMMVVEEKVSVPKIPKFGC